MALKISATAISKRHFSSLFVASDGKASWLDIFIFGAIPILIGTALAHDLDSISDAAISGAIAVFSIFGALLLSVQIALFGISQREILDGGEGKKTASVKERKSGNRAKLIKELNVNISFLIMFSVISLVAFLSFGTLMFPETIEIFYYGHSVSFFALNMMMAVKRAFVLFDEEYS